MFNFVTPNNAKFLFYSSTFLAVMFQELGSEERNAVLSLVVINLPYEDGVDDHKLGTLEGRFVTWRDDFLAALNRELQLPDHSSEDFLPLVSHKYIESKEEMQLREEMSLPSICTLHNADLDGLNFLAYLLIDLIELRKFDSRGSVLFRNIIQRMKVSPQEGVWLTSQMAIFLAKRCEEISHIQQKQKDKYRYAKIGAVAVGAGAIVFVTAGLAAPAVAGALIMLGTGTAAAAGIASGLVVIFGGTAAGLAGYKMSNRTRGLTDFEFKQYDEKGKMEVVVMVSGWMEEDEDDKRTFGVLPDQMSLNERLTRFYRCHDPDRLSKVANEVECFEDDPEPLFDQIREQYGLDPMQQDTLIPASLLPPGVSAEEGDETKNPYAQLFAACFEQLAASAKVAEERAKQEKASSSSARAPATACPTHPTSKQGAVDGNNQSEDVAEKLPVASLLSVGDGTEDAVEDAVPTPDPLPESEAERLRAELERIEQEKKEAKDVHLVDEFPYWHWRELTVSPMYELTLLHWEKQLQKDLGKSILNIIKLFSGYAVGTAIQFTLLRALAASLTMPLLLIQLTDVIDNLWLIAAERAEVAGKEMAKALLLRPHGSRPVTLVGYSMGCRVIFSCLKELARRLEELEDPAIAEVVLEPPQEEGASKPAQTESVGDTPVNTSGGDQGSAPADKKKADAVEGSSSSYFSAFTGMFGSRTKAKHETTEAAASDTGATKQARPAADEAALEVEAKAVEKDTAEQNASTVRTVRELRGLIKDVALLGAPLNLKSRSWPRVRRVVSGRLINGYSGDDIILSVIYRFERYKVNVCGVAPVVVPGIENVDLSHIVTQHIHYCTKMKEILEELNLASALPHESSYRVWQKEES